MLTERMPVTRWIRLGILALLSVALGGAALGGAQSVPSEPDTDSTEPRLGSNVHRDSPRGTLEKFLEDCRANDYAAAAEYLDPGSTGADTAVLSRHLHVVLDQKLWLDLPTLSGAPEGDLDDGLPPDLEKVGSIETSKGEVDILLARQASGSDPAWRFSKATVEVVPTLYGEFGYGTLGEWLPDPLFKIRWLETRLWQWIGLVAVIALAYLVSWIVTAVVRRIVRAMVKRTHADVDDLILSVTVKPFRLVLAAGLFFVGARALHLAVPVQGFLDGLIRVVIILAATWLALRIVDGFQAQLRSRLEEQGNRGAVAVIPLGVKTAKAILVLLAGIAMLQHLGFNVTGVIAGLGVGGIALALAAQKTIENLFGGATLIADQPVRVGDFCRFGDKVGTVEDIGLRSTRVRTLDRTVVSVPNSSFSQAELENFAKRDRLRLFCMLGLRYETTPDQLRHVLAGLRRLLLAHPKVLADPARVRFVGFGAYSLDLEVFAFVGTTDWNEFLAVREDIYLRMMDVVSESGTGFAFPSQTTYLSRDQGLDRDRTSKAEQEVEAWRQDSKLPFPRFDEATIAELDDTIDYPPEGSAVAGS